MSRCAQTLTRADAPAPDTLGSDIDRAGSIITSAIGADSPLPGRLIALRDRLKQQRLQIAVLGQFKRGKSTFVNALIGAPVLPTDVVPVTAIPTFISWNEQPSILVRYGDRRNPDRFSVATADDVRAALFRFVSEAGNPKNRLGVDRVELFYPAPILAGGTVLIDTPGIGSTLTHNTDEALRVLPECDASLFIVSPDPPITQAELDYLRMLKPHVGRVFIVVNKIDYLAIDERQAVIDFLRDTLSDAALIESGTAIFGVSAKAGLSARQNANNDAWGQSGMADIEDQLRHYLATEKTQSLKNAVRQKASDILMQADDELALRSKALKMPFEELQFRSLEFTQALENIEAQRWTVRDLLSGDRRRLVAHLEAEIAILRKRALSSLIGVIDDGLSHVDGTWQDKIKSGVAAEIKQAFGAAREEFVAEFSRRADDIVADHRTRADALIEQVRRLAAEMFDFTFADVNAPETFHLMQEPYWTTEHIASTLIPDINRVLGGLLPLAVRRKRRRRQIVAEVDDLIVRNAESLRWAILRGLDETFRTASAQLDHLLADAISATKGVIQDVVARRRDQSFVVQDALERLDRSRQDLNAVRSTLLPFGEPASR